MDLEAERGSAGQKSKALHETIPRTVANHQDRTVLGFIRNRFLC